MSRWFQPFSQEHSFTFAQRIVNLLLSSTSQYIEHKSSFGFPWDHKVTPAPALVATDDTNAGLLLVNPEWQPVLGGACDVTHRNHHYSQWLHFSLVSSSKHNREGYKNWKLGKYGHRVLTTLYGYGLWCSPGILQRNCEGTIFACLILAPNTFV